MKKLPISKTVFRELIQEDCCYVDKTNFVHLLANDHSKYWFLSRPRRFGKSLFLDTIRAAFAGEQELFKGLYIEDKWDWNAKHPVLKIDFGSGSIESKDELDGRLHELLREVSLLHDISLESHTATGCFREMIIKLHEKYNSRIVVLIDEYDKPLLDNLTSLNAPEIRDALSSFYSVLKASDQYLRFVFLTGVSKFSKTSIFSKLNNLVDISLNQKYADICGYTQPELEHVFMEYLEGVDLAKVKEWYDGYNFLGSQLYNPFDVLLFLAERKYSCYWFETGTPTFLLDIIKEQKYFLPNLDNVQLSEAALGEFEITNITLETLLYQTGYLTIDREVAGGPTSNYKLRIPNNEVRIGLNDYLLRMFYAPGGQAVRQNTLSNTVYSALLENKPDLLENAFQSFFSGVPHDWYRKNKIAEYEGYYCSMFYALFSALGLDIRPEDVSSLGKVDFTIVMERSIYVFEVKISSNSKNAMEQLKKMGYHKKYLAAGKDIFLIGIEFDVWEKNISKYEWEKKKK